MVTASAPFSFSGVGVQERGVRTSLGSDVFPCGLTAVQSEHGGGVTGKLSERGDI